MINLRQVTSRAEEALEDAKLNYQFDRVRVCISRSYYSLFYCMQALIFSKQHFSKTHKGVLNLFNLHFIKTGIIDIKYAEIARSALEDRQKADYDFESEFTDAEVKNLIASAEEFIEVVKDYLSSQKLL